MRKLLFLFILCIGATNLLYAQNGSIIDTSKIKKVLRLEVYNDTKI